MRPSHSPNELWCLQCVKNYETLCKGCGHFFKPFRHERADREFCIRCIKSIYNNNCIHCGTQTEYFSERGYCQECEDQASRYDLTGKTNSVDLVLCANCRRNLTHNSSFMCDTCLRIKKKW